MSTSLKQFERQSVHFSGSCGKLLQSPALDEALMNTSFTTQEQQIILMTVSHEIGRDTITCLLEEEEEDICTLPAFISESIRNDKPIESEKLQALRQFTTEVIKLRDRANQRMVDVYIVAGYSKTSAQDLLSCINRTVLLNNPNHTIESALKAESKRKNWQQLRLCACQPNANKQVSVQGC